MEESYAVGVRIALQGDIAGAIQRVIGEFSKLDSAVQGTQNYVRDLNAGMKALTIESGSAVKGWTAAASAMDRAATAAQRAAAAWRSMPAPAVPGGPGAQPGQTWRDAAGAPPSGSRALVPYRTDRTDYTLSGAPYTPHGGYGPSRPMRPVPGALVPYSGTGDNQGGFTLHGDPYDPRRPGGLPAIYEPPDTRIPLAGIAPRDRLSERMAQPPTAKEGDTFLQGAFAYLSGDIVTSAFKNAGSAQASLAGLASQNWSPGEIAEARQEAFDLQRTIRPSTVQSNLDVIRTLYSVLQSVPEALQLAPTIVKAAATLEPGKPGATDDVFALARAAEIKGEIGHVDPKTGKRVVSADELKQFVGQVVGANYLAPHALTPQAWYEFIRSGGTGTAMALTGPMFADNAAAIMAMGPRQAGTAVQGFSQQFSSGKMSQGALQMLTDMDIVTHPELARKLGYGQFMLKPGAMPMHFLQDARDDPVKFITDDLLPKVKQYLHKNYGAAYDKADPDHQLQMQEATFQQLASRIPGGNYMSEIIRAMPLILRDRAALAKMPSLDQIYATQVGQNPELHAAALNASLTALSTTLGSASMGDSVHVLDQLTAALNTISSVAEGHMKATGAALDALAAGSTGVGLGVAIKLGAKILGLSSDLGPAGHCAGDGCGCDRWSDQGL